MLAPLALFEGRRAIDACQEREAFRRATLLHGLSAGLDASPAELDALALDPGAEHADDLPGLVATAVETSSAVRGTFRDRRALAKAWTDGSGASTVNGALAPSRHLFTCTIGAVLDGMGVQAFCAMVAPDAAEVRGRLRERFGEELAADALIRPGFDWSEPMATAMVSDAIADMLALVAADPESSLADGLDVQLEQRFTA